MSKTQPLSFVPNLYPLYKYLIGRIVILSLCACVPVCLSVCVCVCMLATCVVGAQSNSNHPMSGQLMIFWAPPRAWVTSQAMLFVAHASSSWLQMPVLHCCYSWWSSHGTGISKTMHDPFSPGPSTSIEAAPSPVAFHGFSQCWALAALHYPFMPSKPVPRG